jgi:anti-anti-sigma factor
VTLRPFSYELSADRSTLTLRGELDEVASVALRELLTSLSGEPGAGLRVELSDVDFLPSAALGVLAAARGAAPAGAMTFVAAPGTIAQRVLRICSLPYDET